MKYPWTATSFSYGSGKRKKSVSKVTDRPNSERRTNQSSHNILQRKGKKKSLQQHLTLFLYNNNNNNSNMTSFIKNTMLALALALISSVKATTTSSDYKVCQAETRQTIWGVDRLTPPTTTTSQDCAATTSRRLQQQQEQWGRRTTGLPDATTVVALYDGHAHATGGFVRPAANWAHTLTCQYASQVTHIEYHVSDGVTSNGLTRIEFDNDAVLWIVAFDTTDVLKEMDSRQADALVPEWMQAIMQIGNAQKPAWIVAAQPNCWNDSDVDNLDSTCHTYQAVINQFDASNRIMLENDNDGDVTAFLRKADNCPVSPLDRMAWDITEKLFA